MRRDVPFVLIVDGYPDAAESTREVLSLYGIRAKTAASCAEAVALSRAECPAAVVTDMLLPDGNGDTLAGLLRAMPSPRPAVIAIGSSSRGSGDAFNEWFLKPADPRQLAETLRGYVPFSGGRAERHPLHRRPAVV